MYDLKFEKKETQGQDIDETRNILISAEQFKRNCETTAGMTYSILLPRETPSIGVFYSPNMVCPIIDHLLVFSGGKLIWGDAEGKGIDKEAVMQFNEHGEYIEILFNYAKRGGVLIEDYDWMMRADNISQDWIYLFLKVVSNVDEHLVSNMIFFHDFKSGKNKPQVLRVSDDIYQICKTIIQSMARI